MIAISSWRILRTAWQNFWRNIWLSLATTVVMVMTLLLMSFLYFANIFGGEVLQSIEKKVDLSITFQANVADENIAAIAAELESRPDVESTRIISSDEALNIFRERHKDDPLIEESLSELEDNPLPASLFVVATEPRFYQNIASQLQSDKYAPFVASVNFEDSRAVIDRLIGVINTVKNAAFVITAVFAVLVILIMFNTVRIAIYSYREEIDIMRLVGASHWYIRGPFLIESFLVAVISVIIAALITYPALSFTAPHLEQFFFDADQAENFNLYAYALENWFRVIGLQVLFAGVLAVISSFIAIRRYLR